MLYDLDIEARRAAAEMGVELHRASAVNAHPEFVAMLAELVTMACGGPSASGTERAFPHQNR